MLVLLGGPACSLVVLALLPHLRWHLVVEGRRLRRLQLLPDEVAQPLLLDDVLVALVALAQQQEVEVRIVE